MRGYAVIAILTFAPGLLPAGNKLTWEDRVELTRGLTAEYATVKALLPRSHKPLEFDATGGYDKQQWTQIARESGPAARTGDLVQITKVDIDDDKLVLQINGGYKGGRKWYQGVNVTGTMGQQVPIGNSDSNRTSSRCHALRAGSRRYAPISLREVWFYRFGKGPPVQCTVDRGDF